MSSSYFQRLDRLEPSLSVLGLYLATDLDVLALGVPKVTMITGWDLDGAYKDALRGTVGGLACIFPRSTIHRWHLPVSTW